MTSLWEETRKVPVITSRKRVVAYLRTELDAAPKEASALRVALGEKIAQHEQVIKARRENTDYHVTLRHVGATAPNAADRKLAWPKLLAEWDAKKHELRKATRKRILGVEGGIEAAIKEYCDLNSKKEATFADLLESELARCVEWMKLLNDEADAICQAGMVSADDESHRLFKIGGPSILRELVTEVRAFQEVDPALGED